MQSHVQCVLNTPEIGKCSATALRKLVHDVTANLEALKALQVPVDDSDVFIVAVIISKLDYHTRREFENTLTAELPTRSELIQFLEKKM